MPNSKRIPNWINLVVVAAMVMMVGCGSAVVAASSHGSTSKETHAHTYAGSSSSISASSGGNGDPLVLAVQRTAPAVVNVTSQVSAHTPFGGSVSGTAVGTGFVVRSDGVILTNQHVVEGATSVTVVLPDTRRRLPATVIASDPTHDLAVLKVNATGLPAVAVGSSHGVRLGQQVVAIGYALDLKGGPTVTSGIVSSLNRTIRVGDPNATATGGIRVYRHVFQTDAAINPGNSGGPLLNLAGRVVGIDSAGAQQAQNIGFAIPIDAAKSLLRQALTQVSSA